MTFCLSEIQSSSGPSRTAFILFFEEEGGGGEGKFPKDSWRVGKWFVSDVSVMFSSTPSCVYFTIGTNLSYLPVNWVLN